MARAVLGVIAGYAVWTVIWLAGNALFFASTTESVAAGEFYSAAGPLVGALVLSILCSLAAGATTACIARARAKAAVLVMAVLLLLTGIGVQMGYWSLMPLWYHLVFLLLLVPMAVLGGRLAGRWFPDVEA